MSKLDTVHADESRDGKLHGLGKKPWLTLEEFRTENDNAIGRNSLYSYIAFGRIKSIRIGRKILIPRSELVDFPQRELARQQERK